MINRNQKPVQIVNIFTQCGDIHITCDETQKTIWKGHEMNSLSDNQILLDVIHDVLEQAGYTHVRDDPRVDNDPGTILSLDDHFEAWIQNIATYCEE